MVRAMRLVYVGLAWAFVVGLVVQVFVIGMALFADAATGARFRELHVNLGWVLHLAPLLVLLAAVLARAGSRQWQWALALAVVVFVFPVLATMRDAPALAALHPVGALLGFALAVVVAVNSLRALSAPYPSSSRAETQPTTAT